MGRSRNASDVTVLQDFLHPKSMLTPGVAGGIVMGISTSVGPAVGFDPLSCILVLSFVVGLVVFVTTTTVFLKVVYYILNSLIICTIALGMFVNAKGGVITTGAPPPAAVSPTPEQAKQAAAQGLTVTTIDLATQPPASQPSASKTR